jgi:purine-binding chemotaxis protein CheW
MHEKRKLSTFHLGKELYGIPVEMVEEVIRHQVMTRVPLAPPAVRGLINLRGRILVAIDLRRRLGLSDDPRGRAPSNVVLRTEDGPVSLLVDEIGSVLEVEDGDFEPPPGTLRGSCRKLIKGAYKLEERLLLVLDGDAAARLDAGEDMEEACEPS